MKTSIKLLTSVAVGATAIFSASAANAAITVYTTQAAFTAATSAPGTDTYTGFSITGPTNSPITRSAGAYSYTATASTSSFFGAGTTANPWLSTNLATDSVTFSNFTAGVVAIGGNFFGSDINGAFLAGDVTLTAVDSSGTVTSTIISATTSSFRGFVSTGGLTSLTISAVQTASPIWPTIDNLTLARAAATAVPEPTTWAMMLIGFGMMGATVRYRRRRTTLAYA